LPLLAYVLVVVAQMLVLLGAGGGLFYSACAAPLVALTHVLYGFGFWHGMFTRLGRSPNAAPPSVKLEFASL
jgi:hypothetical protein